MLIANAGIGDARHAADLQPATVANVINVKLLGAVNSVAFVLQILNEAWELVAISDLAAYRVAEVCSVLCEQSRAELFL